MSLTIGALSVDDPIVTAAAVLSLLFLPHAWRLTRGAGTARSARPATAERVLCSAPQLYHRRPGRPAGGLRRARPVAVARCTRRPAVGRSRRTLPTRPEKAS